MVILLCLTLLTFIESWSPKALLHMTKQQCLSVAVKGREHTVKYLCGLKLYNDLRRSHSNISNFEMSSVLSMISTKPQEVWQLQAVQCCSSGHTLWGQVFWVCKSRFHQHVLSVLPWTNHLASRSSVNLILNDTFRVLRHYMLAEYLILTKLLIFDTPVMQLKIKWILKLFFLLSLS